MSFDLARALHDAVDDRPGPRAGVGPVGSLTDAPDVVGHLASRIRRRRVVRAGVRGGVGLAAAGAVAIVGGQIAGRRGPGDVLPAAVPGAEPGTCGSDVAALGASTGQAEISLTALGTSWSDVGGWVHDSSTDLGVLQGRELALSVSAADPTRSRLTAAPVHLLVAHDGVVVGFRPDAILPDVTLIEPLTGLEVAVGGSDDRLSFADVTTWRLSEEALRTGSASSVAGDELTICSSTDGGETGVLLPAGEYDVFAYQDSVVSADTVQRLVAGPWTLSLLDNELTPVVLPPGFPQDVPLVGGTLVDSSALDGTTDDGWLATIEVAGTDGLTRAAGALEDSGYSVGVTGYSASGPSDNGAVVVTGVSAYTASNAAYDVTITESNSDGGLREVEYQIRAR